MATLPYENATSGEKAVQDMQKFLRAFGCSTFGQMLDYEKGELLVRFRYRDMPVTIKASINGYAAAYMRAHPLGPRQNRVEQEGKARDIASVAVYSILRDWIKGQITAVETGILSFEGAFLGQIMLPDGRTVLERVRHERLLPAPGPDPKVTPIGGPK